MSAELLVIRTPSGLSGDMMVTGLVRLLGLSTEPLEGYVQRIGLPALKRALTIVPHFVAGIGGWWAEVLIPHEHAHRSVLDIRKIIEQSRLHESAREVALSAFSHLAQVEGEIHGTPPDQVTFHEVGALDSILDICLTAELYVALGSPRVICSPLPVCDGTVHCQHGLLATPAPAVLRMLEGVPVYGIQAACETVTPTALALLHALQTTYGGWPALTVRRTARAYGARVIPGVPNGAIFAFGTANQAHDGTFGHGDAGHSLPHHHSNN